MNNKKINMPSEIALDSITLKRTHKDFAELRLKTLHENLDHVMEFLTFADSSYSIEDELKYIARCDDNWDNEKTFDFTIFENSTGQYIGCISVMVKSKVRSEYEFGYWLIESAQKKGYMSQAVSALTKCLQEEIKANRIVIRCNDRNLNSAGVALRNGFLFEFRALCGDRDDDFYSFVKLGDKQKQEKLSNMQDQLKKVFELSI